MPWGGEPSGSVLIVEGEGIARAGGGGRFPAGGERALIQSLAAAVEAKDAVTSRHIHRVAELAVGLAAAVDPRLAESDDFLFGCLLHDVGKIGVPERILSKRGPLTHSEWRVMRRHPEAGDRLTRPLGLAATVHDIVLHHHERWDGAGYPDRLAGEAIPLAARIVSVCDALEAMTAVRPYRPPFSPDEALERIRAQAGRQFDPMVVDALDEPVATGPIEVRGVAASRPLASALCVA